MTTTQDRIITINEWAEDLYQFPSPYDYRIAHGGRGSSKTWEFTNALPTLGHMIPNLRVGVAREHLKSLDESAKPELEARITAMGLMRPDCYTMTKTAINHANGTHFFFVGLSKMSEEDIKGLAMVDILWIEEGHRMSASSWELVYPTIRKENAEIWITFNPQYRYQTAWKLAQRTNDPLFWIKQVNWRDNTFFPARSNRDRLQRQRGKPTTLSAHIWEGQPDDVAAANKVLPYELLRLCVDNYHLCPERGAFRTGGLDVADTGEDQNALVLRSGSDLFYAEQWRGSDTFTISDTSRKAAKLAKLHGVTRIDYDAGGVGAGVRGPMREYIRDEKLQLYANPCMFNGKVQGEGVMYLMRRPRSIENGQYFRNWGAQSAMCLRQRADNTRRLVGGDDVDPLRCLFVSPDIPHLEDIMAQWSQAEWDDSTGKLRVIKSPHGPGETPPPSPDMFDAARLAFSSDARYGLKSR